MRKEIDDDESNIGETQEAPLPQRKPQVVPKIPAIKMIENVQIVSPRSEVTSAKIQTKAPDNQTKSEEWTTVKKSKVKRKNKKA